MTWTITLPEMATLPPWVFGVVGVIFWYLGAAVVCRLWYWLAPPEKGSYWDGPVQKFWWWVLSPLCVALYVVVGGTWTLLWLLSLGFILPPWKVEV
jgi:hypothetical protein